MRTRSDYGKTIDPDLLSLADDLNIRPRLENLANAASNDFAVVHHEHTENG